MHYYSTGQYSFSSTVHNAQIDWYIFIMQLENHPIVAHGYNEVLRKLTLIKINHNKTNQNSQLGNETNQNTETGG